MRPTQPLQRRAGPHRPGFFGLQYRPGYTVLPRHQHECAYLALVLSGEYEEAGDQGRFHARPGQLVIHSAFEAHLNRYGAAHCRVLNLPLPAGIDCEAVTMQVADADTAVRLADRDEVEALEFLFSSMSPVRRSPRDWPDALAEALLRNPCLGLGQWARDHHLADATVSRGFQKVFGITPSAYRARVRSRIAWRNCIDTSEPLASLAHRLGFADQAHMTRSVRSLTKRTPGDWRYQVK